MIARRLVPLALLWILATAGAASASPAAGDPPAAGTPPVWNDDVEAAFAQARSSGRNVLVDLTAEWCGWCKVMEKDVFPAPAFREATAQFVLLRVDVEDGGQGEALQRRFRADSLPTLLLLDPHRALIGEVQGYYPAERMAGRIRAELQKHELAVRSYEKVLAGTDPAAWERTALDRLQRGDGVRAAALLEKLLAAPGTDAKKTAWRRFMLADALRLSEALDRAEVALRDATRAATTAGDPQLLERVEWLGFAIARDARDCNRAESALARLAKEHPASPLLGEARRDWSTLKTAAQCS